MNEKQRIKSGDESEIYQAGGDINFTEGISYTEVKDVAMMVFENNFLKLGDRVEEIVNERAEKLISDYLKRIMDEHPEAIVNTIDPDIRAGIYEAQRDYARSGKEETEKLLVELLVERTVNNSSDFSNVVINEALTIVSKLNKIQIDLLTILYVFRNIAFTVSVPAQKYEELLYPFQYLFNIDKKINSDLNFLSYLGCISITPVGSINFFQLLSNKNIEGFSTIKQAEESIEDFPLLLEFRSFFMSSESNLKGSSMTPVGEAIAITNFNNFEHLPTMPYRF